MLVDILIIYQFKKKVVFVCVTAGFQVHLPRNKRALEPQLALLPMVYNLVFWIRRFKGHFHNRVRILSFYLIVTN